MSKVPETWRQNLTGSGAVDEDHLKDLEEKFKMVVMFNIRLICIAYICFVFLKSPVRSCTSWIGPIPALYKYINKQYCGNLVKSAFNAL